MCSNDWKYIHVNEFPFAELPLVNRGKVFSHSEALLWCGLHPVRPPKILNVGLHLPTIHSWPVRRAYDKAFILQTSCCRRKEILARAQRALLEKDFQVITSLALKRVKVVNVLAHIVKDVPGIICVHSVSIMLSQATSLTKFAPSVVEM